MSHGTPASLEEVAGFYTEIRRGSPPSPEQLADLERRYAAIGGVSPLTTRTREQVSGIAGALETLAPGRFAVAGGAKFAAPRIEAAVDELADAGVGRIVGLVLAPHSAEVSVSSAPAMPDTCSRVRVVSGDTPPMAA
jgi:ferrochelatase